MENHPHQTLAAGMVLYIIIFSAISVWKLSHFQYNALDLAIYNQVTYLTSHGQWFGLTIHPHSYLGDHIELTLLLLAPIYRLISHPLTLLFAQTLWLGLGALPLYGIARRKLPTNQALLISLLYLASPFIHNINTFEFHMLSLATPLLLWMFYNYTRQKFWPYLVSLILLVLTREDIALSVIFFSAIPLLEKKPLRWWLTPLLCGGIWFPIAIKLTQHFNAYGHYKFSVYYGWLGHSLPELIQNTILNPSLVVSKVFSPDKIFFMLLIFLSFSLIPLLKPKYLIPTIPVLAAFLLTGGNTGEIVIQSHYTAQLVPWLLIACTYALPEIIKNRPQTWPLKQKIMRILHWEPMLSITVIIFIIIYSFFTLSPVPYAAYVMTKNRLAPDPLTNIQTQLLRSIPKTASVVSSYNTIANLSGRAEIYSLHYIFQGKKQLSDEPYTIAAPIDYLYFDSNDMLKFEHQFEAREKDSDLFSQGDNKLRDFIKVKNLQPEKIIDSIIIYKKDGQSAQKPYEIRQSDGAKNISHQAVEGAANEDMELLGWEDLPGAPGYEDAQGIGFIWSLKQATDVNYRLRILVKNPAGKTIYEKPYALAYGLYPTPEWGLNDTVQTNYWLVLPDRIKTAGNTLSIQLEKTTAGYFTLDYLRSANIQTEKTERGKEIFIKTL